MAIDFTYLTDADGLTSVFPENGLAEITVRNMIETMGRHKLYPHEFEAFRSQARAAGYSVRKAKPVKLTDDELLSLLQ